MVFAIIGIYEQDLDQVKVGQQVTITNKALKTFTGEVSFIYPMIDEATRTRSLRVELKNPAREFLPGMFVNATISISPRTGLAIPRDALIETGKHRYVFVSRSGGRFTPTAVTTGAQDEGFIEITSGLKEGDAVVLSAGFLLDSESRLHGGIK